MRSDYEIKPDFVLHLELDNTTTYFYAFKDPNVGLIRAHNNNTMAESYDGVGAMYFAVAVILIYGVSIALLVGTTLRRSNTDYEVKGFLRSYARLDGERRTKEKLKIRKRLIENNIFPVFPGCTLAAAPNLFDGAAAGHMTNIRSVMTSAAISEVAEDTIQECSQSEGVTSRIFGLSANDIAFIDDSPDRKCAHSIIIEEDQGPFTDGLGNSKYTDQVGSCVDVHSYGINRGDNTGLQISHPVASRRNMYYPEIKIEVE
jgi:hypothetical protein